MAHRIAELLVEADKARKKADRDALKSSVADLVLRLWQHRSCWPEGWPPSSAVAILDQLEQSERFFPGRVEPGNSPWLDAFGKLKSIQAEEQAVWIEAGLLDFDMRQEREAIENHAQDLDTDERETLERLLKMHERARLAILALLDNDEVALDSPSNRAVAIADRLAELKKERSDLLASVVKEIKQAETVVPPSRTVRKAKLKKTAEKGVANSPKAAKKELVKR